MGESDDDRLDELDRLLEGQFYDLEGNPITFREWGALRWRVGPDGMLDEGIRIGRDEIGDVRISTVWLGLDHGYGLGRLEIFETMIFGGELDQMQWRYATREEAEAGHRAAVKLVELELALDDSL